MNKNEITNNIIRLIKDLKKDKDIEITNYSVEPEVESWELYDGTGIEHLSYHFTIKYKKPIKYKKIGGIKIYKK